MSRIVAIHPVVVATSPGGGMLDALDEMEQAAREAKVLFVDVALQLALARHLVAIVGSIELGSEPTVAQVYAIRELRIVTTELRELIVDYSRRR